MTALDLDALLALREQAMPGVWEAHTFELYGVRRSEVLEVGDGCVAECHDPVDAELIVAAVNALPGPCAEVERLRGLLVDMQEWCLSGEEPGDGDLLDRVVAALSDGGDQ